MQAIRKDDWLFACRFPMLTIRRQIVRPPRKITMKSIEHSIPTDEFLRRIDAMPMGARERERAKAHFLAALHFADGLTDGLTALRSLAASLAHGIAQRTTRRSTLRNSPAPR